MIGIVVLNTNRSEYDIRSAADGSMTVGELIKVLEDYYDEKEKVVFSNDSGYTFGYVREGFIEEVYVESKEEEELRERMESLRDELTELEDEYKTQYEREITDEEYRLERENIFELHEITEEQYKNYYFFKS